MLSQNLTVPSVLSRVDFSTYIEPEIEASVPAEKRQSADTRKHELEDIYFYRMTALPSLRTCSFPVVCVCVCVRACVCGVICVCVWCVPVCVYN